MSTSYRFEFEDRYRLPARLFGITDQSAVVTVGATDVEARFGPWTVRTPLAKVASVSITGPYAFVKTAGPAHLSVSDRGITFATNSRRGVCLEFRRPVRGIEPAGVLKHPNLTVTVQDCDALVEQLEVHLGQ